MRNARKSRKISKKMVNLMSNQALNLCEKRYVNLFIILLTHKFCDLVLRLCHLLEIILPIYAFP